ncbi:MAG: NUDIX hydrolase [Methanobacteriota archaeon]|nr:MAG: NUDIX hydrolase [Euryarchaeota archaeon]
MYSGHPSLKLTSIPLSNPIKIVDVDSGGDSVTERCDTCGNDIWPKPSLAVDAIATRDGENGTEVLLIRRGNDPWKGAWAFPGGFVDEGEDPKDAVLRELLEETGITGNSPCLHTVRGNPNRDPRKHIVSIFYLVDVNPESIPVGGDDAAHADWVETDVVINEGMAGDHLEVLLNL